jgi:regulatory protein
MALRLLAIRGRTVSEMKERLLKKGFLPEEVEETLHRLLEQGYLNDQRFALDWAKGRLARVPVGRQRVASELKAKGVGEAAIRRALTEVYGQTDEYQLASRAALRRLPFIQRLPLAKQRHRLFTYLRRLGFSTSIALTVLTEHLGKAPQGAEDLAADDPL